MRVEFFGGPLDGDVVDLIDHDDHQPTSEIATYVGVRIPTDAKTNRYIEAIVAPSTPIVHIYKRGKTGPNGVVRLEYDGYGQIEEVPVGG